MKNTAPLDALRRYFETGETLSYKFRKEQLKKLRKAILDHEKEFYAALAADLGKSPEESWVTELGLVVAELSTAIRDLRSWMAPEYHPTNLLNLPSASKVLREPLGVVLVIGPWNYPAYLMLNPLVGAIAAGNCAVLKPSELAKETAKVIRKIIESSFAGNYVLFVEGDGAEVIPPMMNQFRFDHIFYTGSISTARLIYKMAAERLVPVTLELGGKSPCVVESDANIKVAARRLAITKFANSGQMCVAPDYLLVHNSVREKFIHAIRANVTSFFGDDPKENYNYGRIINTKHFDRLAEFLNDIKIIHGGRMDRDKLYLEPTIVDPGGTSHAIMQEEVFGPVLPVLGYSTREEALAIIRESPNPLSFYIYTTDSKKEEEWLRDVPSGGACVNNSAWHLTNHHLPFGGRGFSGTGNYHGKYSFETFSHKKSVMKTPTWFDPGIKYPPFKGKLNLFKKVIR